MVGMVWHDTWLDDTIICISMPRKDRVQRWVVWKFSHDPKHILLNIFPHYLTHICGCDARQTRIKIWLNFRISCRRGPIHIIFGYARALLLVLKFSISKNVYTPRKEVNLLLLLVIEESHYGDRMSSNLSFTCYTNLAHSFYKSAKKKPRFPKVLCQSISNFLLSFSSSIPCTSSPLALSTA